MMKMNSKQGKSNVNPETVNSVYIKTTVGMIAEICAVRKITAGMILAVEVDVEHGMVRIAASPIELTPNQRRQIGIEFMYDEFVKSFGQVGANGNPGHVFHYEVTNGIVANPDIEQEIVTQLSKIRKADGDYAGEIRFVTSTVGRGFIQRFWQRGSKPMILTGVDSVCYSPRFACYIGRALNVHGQGMAVVAFMRNNAVTDPKTFQNGTNWRKVLTPQQGTTIEALARLIDGVEEDGVAILPIVIRTGDALFDLNAVFISKETGGFNVKWYGERTPTTRIAVGIDADVPGVFFSHTPELRGTVINIQPTRPIVPIIQ